MPFVCKSDKFDGLSSFRACAGGLCAIFYHIACLCGLETDLHLPHHIALQADEDELVFSKPQEESEFTLCEIASGKFSHIESLVEADGFRKECDLQLLISLLDGPYKLVRTQLQDDIGVILPMSVPFVLPKENGGGGGFALWRPVILHIIKESQVFLKVFEVECTKCRGRVCSWPYAVDGETLAELGRGYLSQSWIKDGSHPSL